MSEKKLNTEQIQAYLKKMHTGNLSSHERWQLERASLDDPFLADALEGYYDSSGDHRPRLEKLRDTINSNGESEPKRRFLPRQWLSIAAAVAVLLGVSFWLFDSVGPQDLNTTTAESTSSSNTTIGRNENDLAMDKNPVKIISQPEVAEKIEEKEITSSSKQVITNKQAQPESAAKTIQSKPATPTPIAQSDEPILEEAESQLYDDAEEEAAVVQEITLSEDVKNEYVTAQDIEAPIKSSQARKSTTSKAPESVSKKAKKGANTYNTRETDDLLADESRLNMSKEATTLPQPSPPAEQLQSQLVLLDIDGRALPGVEILDQYNNQLGNSDNNGEFTIPTGLPYVTTAFAGYDSLTIASGPNLTVQMKSSADLLGQAHMRLVDMMDDGELIRHYSNQLNSLFAKEWPLCPYRNNDYGHFTTTSIYIVISNEARVSEIRFFRDLDTTCKDKITKVLEQALAQGVFEKGRPVNFTFRVNL